MYNTDFNKHIKPLLLKNKCELCGITENIDLVYNRDFTDMIIDVYNLIGAYSIWDTLDEKQANVARNMLLGMQISNKNYTLCNECHYTFRKERVK